MLVLQVMIVSCSSSKPPLLLVKEEAPSSAAIAHVATATQSPDSRSLCLSPESGSINSSNRSMQKRFHFKVFNPNLNFRQQKSNSRLARNWNRNLEELEIYCILFEGANENLPTITPDVLPGNMTPTRVIPPSNCCRDPDSNPSSHSTIERVSQKRSLLTPQCPSIHSNPPLLRRSSSLRRRCAGRRCRTNPSTPRAVPISAPH